MDGPSNGGMLYHEVQESNLCAVHCINTVLQGPFFSEFDFAAMASDLDRTERQMMIQSSGDESHNVSMGGDFSIQVLQKALEVWDLQVIPYGCPVAEPAQFNPELERAFICHLLDHWFCIRKVNEEWYNFDSLYAAPEHLSKFYLSAYLASLRGFGWSIFVVRGTFPKDCPISSADVPYSFGQWLSPDDAHRIAKACNPNVSFSQTGNSAKINRNPYQLIEEDDRSLSDMENEDLHAAIAESLLDSLPIGVETVVSPRQTDESSCHPAPLIQTEASPPPSTSEAGTAQEDKKEK
ncbi:hypothetical protein Sjap_013996 [Stephania japonica]|uniref:ubiquitinyl hydrolase 1 n=1 Tax=Stephania japonica TaxID=461633 RepID=A0AAP0IZ28_9MAGN